MPIPPPTAEDLSRDAEKDCRAAPLKASALHSLLLVYIRRAVAAEARVKELEGKVSDLPGLVATGCVEVIAPPGAYPTNTFKQYVPPS